MQILVPSVRYSKSHHRQQIQISVLTFCMTVMMTMAMTTATLRRWYRGDDEEDDDGSSGQRTQSIMYEEKLRLDNNKTVQVCYL